MRGGFPHRARDGHPGGVSKIGETSWRVRELLDGALTDPDFYLDALSQVHLPSWSSGRVALVGDAAYCASPAPGTGAEPAVVGAYRLAEELAGTPDSIPLTVPQPAGPAPPASPMAAARRRGRRRR
ncbi:FAD-dependent monooxygenase [Nonomuraea angiospora]|uniref:FAD-dependent monooxygenase n=1 Tax=Nonomuraea angiospora TaxID=46172 RepID=UPI0034256D04